VAPANKKSDVHAEHRLSGTAAKIEALRRILGLLLAASHAQKHADSWALTLLLSEQCCGCSVAEAALGRHHVKEPNMHCTPGRARFA